MKVLDHIHGLRGNDYGHGTVGASFITMVSLYFHGR